MDGKNRLRGKRNQMRVRVHAVHEGTKKPKECAREGTKKA